MGCICENCIRCMIFINGKTCFKCGKSLDEKYKSSYCPDCKGKEKNYDYAFSCFEYIGIGKQIIHKLKYNNKTELAEVISRFLYNKIKDENLEIDVIIPVPLNEEKLKKRGFNQSKLISQQLGKRLNIPVYPLLTRIRYTHEQFKLNRLEREKNVEDAFSIRMMYNKISHKNILLVDDVYTTGSTVNECSRILKLNGARKIYVITAATGNNT